MIEPPPVFRLMFAGSRLRVIAALILMVILELLLLPICRVSHVTRSSSASVRPSCPAVFVPRSIDREFVCGLKVTVPAETSVLVASRATSSAVKVITPAPDVARSAPAPVVTDSALTIKLLPAVNVMSPLRFTASVPASPLMVRLGNWPAVNAPTLQISLPTPWLTVTLFSPASEIVPESPVMNAPLSTVKMRVAAANLILPGLGSEIMSVSALPALSVTTMALPVVVTR